MNTRPSSLTLFSFFLLLSIFVTGCATTVPAPQQKLFVSCLNEAERVDGKRYVFQAPSRGHSAPKIPTEVYQAKDICFQMRDSSDQKSKETSAQACNAYLKEYAGKHSSDGKHIEAMQGLCQEMTGEHIMLKKNNNQ